MSDERPTERQQMEAAVMKLHDESPSDDLKDYIDPSDTPDPDRPTYRSERHAHDVLTREAESERQAEAEAAERQHREESEERQSEIRRAGTFNSDELAAIQQIGERTRALQDARARYEEWAKDAPADQRQAVEQALAQEQAELQQAGQYIQAAVAEKRLAGGRAQLPKQLENAETREEFIQWAVKKGIPRQQVEGEMNPAAVGVAFRQFREERKEQAAAEKKAKIAEWSRAHSARRGGQDEPKSAADAREQLRASGSVHDALNVLAIEKVERMF